MNREGELEFEIRGTKFRVDCERLSVDIVEGHLLTGNLSSAFLSQLLKKQKELSK